MPCLHAAREAVRHKRAQGHAATEAASRVGHTRTQVHAATEAAAG